MSIGTRMYTRLCRCRIRGKYKLERGEPLSVCALCGDSYPRRLRGPKKKEAVKSKEKAAGL